MIVSNGNYWIWQEGNKLVISLPQIRGQETNTVTPVEDRRENLTSEEMAVILRIVKEMYTEGTNEDHKNYVRGI